MVGGLVAAEPGVSAAAARVVLLGAGADELLAGYGRHRSAFERARAAEAAAGDARVAALAAQRSEMNVDLARLWLRNLGRDDRCVSAAGREPRVPFLSERVVRCLHGMALEDVADLTLPPGVGDKRLLRRLAQERLGLQLSGALVKRAIQFGCRVARAAEAAGGPPP